MPEAESAEEYLPLQDMTEHGTAAPTQYAPRIAHECAPPAEATWGEEWTCPTCSAVFTAEPDDDGEVFEWDKRVIFPPGATS